MADSIPSARPAKPFGVPNSSMLTRFRLGRLLWWQNMGMSVRYKRIAGYKYPLRTVIERVMLVWVGLSKNLRSDVINEKS